MANSISDNDFQKVRDYVYSVSKIELNDGKKYLVEQRLVDILHKFKLPDYTALTTLLENPTAELRDAMISAMTTNETFFFRNSHVFDAISKTIIPELFHNATRSNINIWSAACSTGQEPYTLGMMFREFAEKNRLTHNCSNITIKASDLDMTVLNKAKKGIYSSLEINRGLSSELKEKYFHKIDDKNWQINEMFRKRITFFKLNLTNSAMFPQNMDLILCRNVLIYFDLETKKKIIDTLYRSLKPKGYLVVGSSESLYGINDEFIKRESEGVIFYQKP